MIFSVVAVCRASLGNIVLFALSDHAIRSLRSANEQLKVTDSHLARTLGRMDQVASTTSKPRTLVIGHRGAPGHRPEHTESAYRLAFELGADAVEPDIVLSSDGVLLVRHENEISGTTDVADRPEFADRRTTKKVDGERLTGWFTEDFTWAELSTLRSRERLPALRTENTLFDDTEGILRLSDVLALIDEATAASGRELRAVIEIKHAYYFTQLGWDIAGLLYQELERCGWAARPERLVIECFELGVLDRLRALGVAAQLLFLLESSGAPADEPNPRRRSYEWYRSDAGLDALVGRVQGISLAKRDLLASDASGRGADKHPIVQRAHARGLVVFVWTLRPENRFLDSRFRIGSAGGTVDPAAWGDWRSEFELILSTGVDGVFLDHPELGTAARDSLQAS